MTLSVGFLIMRDLFSPIHNAKLYGRSTSQFNTFHVVRAQGTIALNDPRKCPKHIDFLYTVPFEGTQIMFSHRLRTVCLKL